MKCIKCDNPSTMVISIFGEIEHWCDKCYDKEVEKGRKLLEQFRKRNQR